MTQKSKPSPKSGERKEEAFVEMKKLICFCGFRNLVVIDHIEGEEIHTCGKCGKRIYD